MNKINRILEEWRLYHKNPAYNDLLEVASEYNALYATLIKTLELKSDEYLTFTSHDKEVIAVNIRDEENRILRILWNK